MKEMSTTKEILDEWHKEFVTMLIYTPTTPMNRPILVPPKIAAEWKARKKVKNSKIEYIHGVPCHRSEYAPKHE